MTNRALVKIDSSYVLFELIDEVWTKTSTYDFVSDPVEQGLPAVQGLDVEVLEYTTLFPEVAE